MSSAGDGPGSAAGRPAASPSPPEELPDAHALVDALFASSPVGLAFYDRHLRCVRINAALADISGVPIDEVVGKRPDEYLPNELGQRITASFSRVLETGEPNVGFEVSGETRRAPGQRRHWLATHYPVPGPDGRPVGVGVVVHEITARKTGQEALRKADERLRALLATLPVGVVIADETGRIAQSNAAAERIWGRTPQLPIDQYVEYEGYWPDGRRVQSNEWALARALEKGETAVGEVIRIVNFDGEAKTILNNGAPLRDADGNIFGAVVAFQDITEVGRMHEEQRFLAEAGVALGASLDWEATLRQIAELAVPRLADWCSVDLVEGDGIRPIAMVHTPALQATAETRRKYPASSVPNHPVLRAIQSGAPVLAARFDDLIDSFARDPEYRRIVEGLGLRSYMVVPLGLQGRIFGALTFATADSNRTFGAAELALAEELARRASLAVENARLYREAQQATRLRQSILGVVSHDLKNPLSALRLNCALLERRASTEPVHKTVHAMKQTILRMDRMVTDLVDIAALEAGQLRIERASYQPAQIASEAVDNCQPLAQEKGVALSCEVAPELPAVCCDRGRVLQVLANLVGNAIKVTEEGGRIDVTAEAQGTEVVFAVRDTGSGIAEDELPQLFERFWRGREAGYKGTGLGLSIAKALVEANDGRIWVESQLGVGSTFRFSLPLARAEDSVIRRR